MLQVTKKQNILWQWVEWQFFDMPKALLKGWHNYLKFYLNYFSIFLLLKTLFSPWRRYKWYAGRGFDIGKWLEARFSNLISRSLGAIMRISLILVGILFEFFVFFAGLVAFLAWLILPFLLLWGLSLGVKALF